MSATEAPPSTPYGSCAYCGDAVPPGADRCPICGSPRVVPAGTRPPRNVRRRLWLLGAARLLIIMGVIVGLGFLVATQAFTGAPTIADPLTHSGTYVIDPGNFTILAGEISGEDYVTGNFTVLAPAGGALNVVVYNTSEFMAFQNGTPTENQTWAETSESECLPYCGAPIGFAAPYTDTFYFVFFNPYPPTSPYTEIVYISTEYYTNVVTFS